jgi:tRNA-dihydrouridine synthase B
VAAFRRLHGDRFGGVDFSVAPFIPLVAGHRIVPRLLADVLPEACGRAPATPQVIGKDPEALRVMATALQDLGYREMNLNCGCPWKKVAKKGRGSGLPEDEDAFFRMLDAGCDAMPGGFSIKIRLGRTTNDTLARLAPRIAQYPLASIAIHPRTGVQMYDGAVDLDAFAAVLPLFPMPVVYNGDVRTLADYARIAVRFPAIAGVMIGRGLIADPTLAESIRAWEEGGRGDVSTPPRDPARVMAFVDELYATYRATLCGPSPVLGRMKELWGHLHAYFDDDPARLRKIQRSHSLAEYERAVKL